ncbi:MAG: metalloregulator ArsR/SmtB family transcription factor [Pseudomonadota bacterium]
MQYLNQAFAALGDRTRLAIVEKLLREGEMAVGDLKEVSPLSPPAISRHLKVLREAGIIHQRVDRQRRLYSVCPDAIQSIGDWTMRHRVFWENSLDRLEDALKFNEPPM